LLDTPGLSDPEVPVASNHAKIIASVAMMAEDHPTAEFAVALVASLAGRMDDPTMDAFSQLGRVFGPKLYDHAIVIWTHGDMLLEPTFAAGFPGSMPSASGEPMNAAAAGDVAAVDAAFQTYIASAGPAVAGFIDGIRGGSLILNNRESRRQAGSDRHQLARVVERASAVATVAGRLAPPKKHRKTARRERQQASLEEARERRALEDEDKGAPGGSEMSGGYGFCSLMANWF
jgi:hypothetical protein